MLQHRIVLADDDRQILSFLTAILKAHDFDVHEASDGCDAMELLTALGGAVDLLITDIKMPRMDGTALARAVAEMFPSIPVLFISGWTDPLESPEWRKSGYAFLQKPFRPRELISSVERLLAGPKATSASSAFA